ncbi:60S ribosomal protein L31 [Candidatus Bathyarchaeota archaeon]|nr:60S ribosomal protein L31 [Candidatus Bathyarchaeota archaeon]
MSNEEVKNTVNEEGPLEEEPVEAEQVEEPAKTVEQVKVRAGEFVKEPAKTEVEEGPEIDEDIEIVDEKFYTINLRDVWKGPRIKRAPKAVRIVRDFVKRRMKVDDVKISNAVNQEIWKRSIKKPPRKIKIRAVKDKEGQVIVFHATGK